MPSRRLPNSIPAVLRTLTTARDTYLNVTAPAERPLSAAQWAKLDPADPAALLNRLLKEASDVDKALAAQVPLSTQVARTMARLTMFVSHFHQVYDLGVARGTFTAGARALFGRDASAGALPDLSSHDAVALAAGKVVEGEAARQTAEGAAYRPMALPSAAEVGALVTEFNGERASSQLSQMRTDTQREELQALYPEAQALAVDICDTVEFFYRGDKSAPSRRQKSRRWGVVYLYDDNETPDPGDNSTGQMETAAPVPNGAGDTLPGA